MGDGRPRLAVHKFASCDGCQLTLLDCEDALLEVAGAIDIAYFPEASSDYGEPPFDLALVEGSITTEHDRQRLLRLREDSRALITLGACATAGGIQALKNLGDHEEMVRAVYAHPAYIKTLATSTPISAHVKVDYELRGCPITPEQLLEVIGAFLVGRRPAIEDASVCLECKRRGNVCVMVAQGTPCLGPITHAGCGALCPSFDRGCYGCFGPQEKVNATPLMQAWAALGVSRQARARALATYNTAAPAFEKARRDIEQADH